MLSSQAVAQFQRLVEAEIRSGSNSALQSAFDSAGQAIRRLRQAGSEQDVVALLLNVGNGGEGCVCLTFDGEFAQAGDLRFPIHDSPALVTVIETRDTVVTMASARELSQPLEQLLHSEERAQLTPVVARNAVQMVIVTASNADHQALGLLCEAAGMHLELLAREAPPVRMDDAPVSDSTTKSNTKWNELTPEDQALHLRAQRFAQVAVARLRVDHGAALRDGLVRGDVYSALKPEIDGARSAFREQFLQGKSKSMVDYLYLELVRSLANNEDHVLGSGFPGRLT